MPELTQEQMDYLDLPSSKELEYVNNLLKMAYLQ